MMVSLNHNTWILSHGRRTLPSSRANILYTVWVSPDELFYIGRKWIVLISKHWGIKWSIRGLWNREGKWLQIWASCCSLSRDQFDSHSIDRSHPTDLGCTSFRCILGNTCIRWDQHTLRACNHVHTELIKNLKERHKGSSGNNKKGLNWWPETT